MTKKYVYFVSFNCSFNDKASSIANYFPSSLIVTLNNKIVDADSLIGLELELRTIMQTLYKKDDCLTCVNNFILLREESVE